MKTLILIAFLTLCTSSYCFCQLALTKKEKTISLDTKRIWGIKTNTVLLLSFFDYKYDNKRKKYNDHLKFRLDSITKMTIIGETLKVSAVVIHHFIDTTNGTIYSNAEIDKQWSNGNYKTRRVLSDTAFYFNVNEIDEMQVQTREYRAADGMAMVGLLVFGTIGIVVGTVEVFKGNPNGYYGLGGGLAVLGLMKHSLNKSRWLEDFEIGKKDWKIVAK